MQNVNPFLPAHGWAAGSQIDNGGNPEVDISGQFDAKQNKTANCGSLEAQLTILLPPHPSKYHPFTLQRIHGIGCCFGAL